MKELYIKLWNTFHPETPFQAWLLAICAFSILVGIIVKIYIGEGFFKSALIMFAVILINIIAWYIWVPIGILVSGILAADIACQFIDDGRWHGYVYATVVAAAVFAAVYCIWLR